MVKREPVRVDYRAPHAPPQYTNFGRPNWNKFLAGLAIGTSISLIYWPSLWSKIDGGRGDVALLIYGLPIAKFIAAIILMVIPGWASFGTGLLLSIALGFLIFFGTCAMNFKL